MPTMQNQSFLDFELCDEAVSVHSEPVDIDVIDLTMTKVASCDKVVVGKDICYTVTIVNNSDVEIDGTFRDPLDENVEYVTGSFKVTVGEDHPIEENPTISPENVMTYPITIPADETVVIEFCVKVASVPTDHEGDDEGDDQP